MTGLRDAPRSLAQPIVGAVHVRAMVDGPFRGCQAVKIGPGEFTVSSDPEEAVLTVLGSCVAACIRDPVVKVGGMNHFMLPGKGAAQWGTDSASLRYGTFAMERLVNELLKRGAMRSRLEVKLFGGAVVGSGCASIGARNAAFAQDYLRAEGMVPMITDLGGNQARRVVYQPVDGRAFVRVLPELQQDVAENEGRLRRHLALRPIAGSVELF